MAMGACFLSIGGWRHVDPKRLLDSQPGSMPDPCLKGKRQKMREDTQWSPLVASCIFMGMDIHMHICTFK